METISRDELKQKLDRGDDFKLVFVLGDWAFKAQHIPGSIHVSDEESGQRLLGPEDEIVVYCSSDSCQASVYAYQRLKRSGFEHVRRYSGGLSDWYDAGYPLEGELAESKN